MSPIPFSFSCTLDFSCTAKKTSKQQLETRNINTTKNNETKPTTKKIQLKMFAVNIRNENNNKQMEEKRQTNNNFNIQNKGQSPKLEEDLLQ